jgi:phosphoglycolate phosphatase (TIGR01487 family)
MSRENIRIKIIATDIDGTLTIDRNSYEILPEVVSRIQMLSYLGIKTVLVSANALPVALGLARYIGAKGVVAENGCMIAVMNHVEGRNVIIQQLCDWPSFITLKEISSVLQGFANESWQNDYRRCDFAFIPIDKDKALDGLKALEKHLAQKGYDKYISAGFSGYAIHVHPIHCNKLAGLKKILELMNSSLDEVLAIGDSVMDVDIVKHAKIGVAVSNADDELKNVAKYVTKHPSGFGFIEAIDHIVLMRYKDAKQSQ